MGLVETLLEQLSFKFVAGFLVIAYTLWYILSRIDEHVRIRRMGHYGPTMPTRLPLGLDFVYKSVRSTAAQTNLELWQDEFLKVGGKQVWTAEVRLLNERFIFTADPENIKAILATQFSDFGKGEQFHEAWQDFLGDSIFTTDHGQWHASRQLIRPQFTRDRVSDLHCFESHMETLFRAIANGGPLNGEDQPVPDADSSKADGKVLDISDLFFRYALDVTTDFLLGTDVKSLSNPKQEFAEAFNDVQRWQNIIARMARLRPLLPKGSFWKSLDVVNEFINRYIEKVLRMSPEEVAAKTKEDKGYTFLHALAGFTRDRKVLRDQIVAVLLAGRDTTASALSWAIYEMSRHPHTVRKLRAEILETVGPEGSGRTPTYEHLKNMPYLRAVINEVLRMYPAVPFNVRIAHHDAILPRGGGPDGSEPLPVLRGTQICYSTLVMQRRADLYPAVSDTFADPAIFSPERWAHWHPKPHDYIPFNSGPRICIGQQFALTEVSYVLCRLFQRYDRLANYMHEVDGGDPLLKADIVLSPGQGVRVALWRAKE